MSTVPDLPCVRFACSVGRTLKHKSEYRRFECYVRMTSYLEQENHGATLNIKIFFSADDNLIFEIARLVASLEP